MSSQFELVEFEAKGAVMGYASRQKRLGSLRTDIHTEYEVPFYAALDSLSTKDLQKIVRNKSGKYSSDLKAQAREVIREREDPQDWDMVATEM